MNKQKITNSILKNTDFLKNSWFFKEKNLKKWELLFDEWDIDNYIYIIVSGFLSIEKYTTKQRKISKKLAILKQWDFLWEWSIRNKKKKENRVISVWDTDLLYLDIKDISSFVKSFPIESTDFFTEIIDKTNKRLLDSNKQVAANYDLSLAISNMTKINPKTICWLIDKTKDIMDCDYILYFENNNIVTNTLILRYDSRQKWHLQDDLFEKDLIARDLQKFQEKCDIDFKHIILVSKLSIWDKLLWYIIFCKENLVFSDNERKVAKAMSTSLAWVINQYLIKKEEMNKTYLKGY